METRRWTKSAGLLGLVGTIALGCGPGVAPATTDGGASNGETGTTRGDATDEADGETVGLATDGSDTTGSTRGSDDEGTTTNATTAEDDTLGSSDTGDRDAICGDAQVGGTEECDDANEVPGDGCEIDCTFTPGARMVAAGGSHTCALTWAGTVHCWGGNAFGQLGYGHTESIGDNEPPSDAGAVAVGGFVVEIVAGLEHTCARLDTGSLRCWGQGWGQLGYLPLGHVGDDELPEDAGDVDVGGVVTRVWAGGPVTCAQLDTGGLRCWGDPIFGFPHVGYPGPLDVGIDLTPAEAGDLPLPEPVVDVGLGSEHTCVVGASGAVYCWGNNMGAALSIPSAELGVAFDATEAVVVPLGTEAVEIGAGYPFSIVRTTSDDTRAWGSYFSLGYGIGYTYVGEDISPAAAGDIPFGEPVLEVSAGAWGFCARGPSGVRCWAIAIGLPEVDQIGFFDTPADHPFIDIGAPVVALSAADPFANHCCAVTDTGGVRCWGLGFVGQLGHVATGVIGDTLPPSAYGDVPFL